MIKNNIKKVLVISPHPDDETLGVGGTLIYHKNRGDLIFWINITLPQNAGRKEIRLIQKQKISEFIQFDKVYQMNFESTKLEGTTDEMIAKLTNLFQEIMPNIVYLPNRSDVHSDHRLTFKAGYSCTKSFRSHSIERILMYETLSETEFAPALSENAFAPNVFVDISDYMEQKIRMLKIYNKELMPHNLPRSISAIRSLAGYRGSRIGVEYAEAFMLLFEKC
jgi:N-acetylglucosamine malate deacetylase 1